MVEITQGEDETLHIYVTTEVDGEEVAVNLTGGTIYFTVKSKINLSDSNALIQKEVTEHENQTTATGKTNIELTRAETKLPAGEYWMDLWLELSGNHTQIYSTSREFIIKPTITRTI